MFHQLQCTTIHIHNIHTYIYINTTKLFNQTTSDTQFVPMYNDQSSPVEIWSSSTVKVLASSPTELPSTLINFIQW